jgi:hypothetical protein
MHPGNACEGPPGLVAVGALEGAAALEGVPGLAGSTGVPGRAATTPGPLNWAGRAVAATAG